MSIVLRIGTAKNNNQNIEEVSFVKVLANKGIVGDRHFNEYNSPYNQITLIESENIDYYNKKYNLDIPYIDFRRNIVTKGIKLNDLIDKKILVGDVKIEAIDLCRPCRYLQERLDQTNIIKEFLRRGGLRCRILNSSKIEVGDIIEVVN